VLRRVRLEGGYSCKSHVLHDPYSTRSDRYCHFAFGVDESALGGWGAVEGYMCGMTHIRINLIIVTI